MEKIAIIGLGLVGNSIGMGLKKQVAGTQAVQIVGFDPDRTLEDEASRRHMSVDSIAPDLESAVRGAQTVILSVPTSAMREVLQAIDQFLEPDAVVTDTLPTKDQVMSWAGELLTSGNFVGGHPLSRFADTEAPGPDDLPRADLFSKSPYCIMPLPRASGDALNRVIGLAQALGANPLFIDPSEHDALFAAANQLPIAASAVLMRLVSSSPSWQDIGALGSGQLGNVSTGLATDPRHLADSIDANRQSLLHWIDQYMYALHELREMLSQGDSEAVAALITQSHEARDQWLRRQKAAQEQDPHLARQLEPTEELRADLQQAIRDTRPGSRILGRYLTDRMFGKKEK